MDKTSTICITVLLIITIVSSLVATTYNASENRRVYEQCLNTVKQVAEIKQGSYSIVSLPNCYK